VDSEVCRKNTTINIRVLLEVVRDDLYALKVYLIMDFYHI
jgi:hypothetical protein